MFEIEVPAPIVRTSRKTDHRCDRWLAGCHCDYSNLAGSLPALAGLSSAPFAAKHSGTLF
jgi:hypothetical protein